MRHYKLPKIKKCEQKKKEKQKIKEIKKEFGKRVKESKLREFMEITKENIHEANKDNPKDINNLLPFDLRNKFLFIDETKDGKLNRTIKECITEKRCGKGYINWKYRIYDGEYIVLIFDYFLGDDSFFCGNLGKILVKHKIWNDASQVRNGDFLEVLNFARIESQNPIRIGNKEIIKYSSQNNPDACTKIVIAIHDPRWWTI
jgi:hypothetical protein